MKAKFIVIEGIEGAGKSSAINLITHWLYANGIKNIITTREPGGTPIAEEIRQITKHQYPDDVMHVMTELLLMYASRVQLVKSRIQPALTEGTWVIGDRHELSTLAYQGGGRGIPFTTIEELSNYTLAGFKPDLTIYLDVDPKIGFERIHSRAVKDRFEQESVEFFNRVRNVYLDYAAKDSTIYQVNANQALADVHADIIEILEKNVELAND